MQLSEGLWNLLTPVNYWQPLESLGFSHERSISESTNGNAESCIKPAIGLMAGESRLERTPCGALSGRRLLFGGTVCLGSRGAAPLSWPETAVWMMTRAVGLKG